jgi:chromosome segregation ATPase
MTHPTDDELEAWKARAEAAEAERDEALNQLDSARHSVDVLEKRVGVFKAENARLREALLECQEEIDAYIQNEYPHDHPVQERYRQRDYAANPVRAALQEKDT